MLSVRKYQFLTGLVKACRPFSSTEASLLTNPQQSEVSIPVPWGKIAGKSWGNPNGPPVLCIHGWLDNACSFDRMAPLLPNDKFNFVAIELPGHGFSSHYPPGMSYRFSDAFIVIRYAKEFLNWDKFAIMGHSLGAGVGIWYSSIFPADVDKLIAIDLVNIGPLTLEKHVKHTKKAILSSVDTFKKLTPTSELEKPHKVPTYAYIDAVSRAFMANNIAHGQSAITQESVECLMKRGLIKMGEDKYTWSADLRLRIPQAFHVLEEQVEHYAAAIKCPMMLLKATESSYYMQEEMAKRIIKVYMNHNPNFVMHKIEGGHSVHLNKPQVVIDHVNNFLLKTDFHPEEETKPENFPLDLF